MSTSKNFQCVHPKCLNIFISGYFVAENVAGKVLLLKYMLLFVTLKITLKKTITISRPKLITYSKTIKWQVTTRH